MSIWYEQKGPMDDVVISSRVRLARNLVKYPFPHRCGRNDSLAVANEINAAISGMSDGTQLHYTSFDKFNQNDLDYLVEKHLISREMAAKQGTRGIITNKDESLCVMVNEEDHLRIQSLLPGLQFELAYKMCYDFENKLNKFIPFAFDETLGYLTSCPTNVGTGLRASAMMFLPGMVNTGMMNKILEACIKFGVAVRGAFGENSEALGYIFQISNQVTLGLSEEELINNITHIINQISEQERMIRNEIYAKNQVSFEDRVFRAYGILANARSVTTQEAMELMASVRLGIAKQILKYIDIREMNKLLVEIQPSNIKKMIGEEVPSEIRDQKRAEIIRNVMNRSVN